MNSYLFGADQRKQGRKEFDRLMLEMWRSLIKCPNLTREGFQKRKETNSREKVSIPHNKPYIFMRGNGKGKTAIDWSQSSEDNIESATFKVEAPHFVAFGISFKNEAPTGIAYTSQNQSVAAYVGADMVAFYHCAFYSSHNTLFDLKGRHYYDSCYIQGSIDFIFGLAQSIFHSCEIFVIADRRMEIHGSITAHKRESAKENTGFVFIKGQVFGIGDVYLGRAKGAYSRVIFANTYISKTVVPQGWTNWSYAGSTENVVIGSRNLHHAEYNCHGPGSNSTNRAPWSKQLSDKEAAPFLSIDFINGKSSFTTIMCRNKKKTSSYVEILESVGVDRPSEILFVTDVYQEAIAAKAAGYTIPVGWVVMVYPPSIHLNPAKYKDPLDFNPWRWEVR
ncbi:hypothetical protein TEA_017907 [Camellia sinensis var. sinensis]|uniref:Pectinesterase n=1 Tax=Camellia sinensis var. sinensis TaxID=542762 RepID=A0A4S4DF57_CAMSN|nr:hypothetical protein TEA_017907 [Camellia sinensis var. sinensis]